MANQNTASTQAPSEIGTNRAIHNTIFQWICSVFCYLKKTFCFVLESTRYWANRYPPIAAFLMAFTATSALPVATFVTVTSISFGTLAFLAVATVSILQGGVLAVSGTILFLILSGCLFISVVSVGGLTTLWMGVGILRYFVSRVFPPTAKYQYPYSSSSFPPVYTMESLAKETKRPESMTTSEQLREQGVRRPTTQAVTA